MHTATLAFPLLVALIAVALGFDFLNGRNDAGNAIATVVATRVLSPGQAVAFAAFFNFAAIGVFGLHVAETVGKGIIDASVITPAVVFGALIGAIVWNMITWWFGIPSSSSHALVGGLIGAGMAKAGPGAIVAAGVTKTALAIVVSPTLGMIFALFLILVTSWLFVRASPSGADKTFRRLQLISSALFSLSHGGNDAQKTMGIITVLLFSQGMLGPVFHVPFWVILSCYSAIALGTLTGGWRIIETMGSRITRLTPHQGFCAEAGGATVIFAASFLGIPVSTTHTITGSIVGVGAARRASAVRWNIASSIVVAWVITIPASAAIGALAYWATRLFG